VADAPPYLPLAEHRDSDRPVELWARRTLLAGLVVLAALALLNVFGQRPVSSSAGGPAGTIEVSAPDAVRGGLFFQGVFTVRAERDLEQATIVLADGWLDSMHVNTIEPAPTEESSRDGELALGFGPLAAGETLVAHLQFQVNPTNVGRRSQAVALYDGTTPVARVDRTLTVFP
jgi:hypothetical protein